MDASGTRLRTVRPGARPPTDLLVSKLLAPLVRPGTAPYLTLLDRLAKDDVGPIVAVTAPAGYGKTTLLSHWARRDGRSFAWLSLDEADNDPKLLLRYVAETLDAVEPVDARVFDALASPVSSVPGSIVPRLGSALRSMSAPVVLVLDDVHVLRNREGCDALSVLAEHVPAGSLLVFSGRDAPPLRVARLRAEGRIVEIGQADLSLTVEAAEALLKEAGVTLGETEVREVHRRTEGWPAGLYLAALCLRQGGTMPGHAVSFGGDDRLVAEYIESEFLSRISEHDRLFLTRTAVLDRLTGPLCEAVLALPGSAATLDDLARSNLLLVPLDRRRQWYRYHHLFRDMLLSELVRRDPGLVPVLQRRASTWHAANGLGDQAVEYAIAAGDVSQTASLVDQLGLAVFRQGRTATLDRWLGWLAERDAIGRRPTLMMEVCICSAISGRPAEADRWADAIDRWQFGDRSGPVGSADEAWATALRAVLCRGGVEQMRVDVEDAITGLTAAGITAPEVAIWRGIAYALCGDIDAADAMLVEAIDAGADVVAPDVLVQGLCKRASTAMDRGDWALAEKLGTQAAGVLRDAGMGQSYVTPLLCGVQARVAAHRGRVPDARRELVSSQRLRPILTYALPCAAVAARIELARAHLALADLAGARTLIREIDQVLKMRPGLGTLAGEAEQLRLRLSRERGVSEPQASALTTAELRVLPMLATHLTFHEIADELFVSTHTIKSHVGSIYRKLGASSRSQAVARSREMALLDGVETDTMRSAG
jgi:LuxR family transcriptional regulator, maltose regulon positive regulatory protein